MDIHNLNSFVIPLLAALGFTILAVLVAVNLGLNDSLKSARLGFSDLSRYAIICSSLNKTCSAISSGRVTLLSISRRN